MNQIKPGQLRQWTRSDPGFWADLVRPDGNVFLILHERPPSEDDDSQTWEFVMNGEVDWHRGDYIVAHSEVISETG